MSTYDYTQYKHKYDSNSHWQEVTGNDTDKVMYFGGVRSYDESSEGNNQIEFKESYYYHIQFIR